MEEFKNGGYFEAIHKTAFTSTCPHAHSFTTLKKHLIEFLRFSNF
jgi:hypothetical protein